MTINRVYGEESELWSGGVKQLTFKVLLVMCLLPVLYFPGEGLTMGFTNIFDILVKLIRK